MSDGSVLVIQGRGKVLTGYPYFWIKAVTGFDPTQHCAKCLRGSWILVGQDRMKLNTPVPLVLRSSSAVGYICGVSEGFQYARNLHIPFVHGDGVIKVDLLNGQQLTLANAKALLIPPLPAGWAGMDKKFTTCRNFQFAASHFGFSEAQVRAANAKLF